MKLSLVAIIVLLVAAPTASGATQAQQIKSLKKQNAALTQQTKRQATKISTSTAQIRSLKSTVTGLTATKLELQRLLTGAQAEAKAAQAGAAAGAEAARFEKDLLIRNHAREIETLQAILGIRTQERDSARIQASENMDAAVNAMSNAELFTLAGKMSAAMESSAGCGYSDSTYTSAGYQSIEFSWFRC